MKMIRYRHAALIILTLFLSTGMMASVAASPDVRHFSLSSFDIDIEYPSTVKPGDTVTISVTATSKSSVYVQDLTAEILVPSLGGEMRLIYTLSIVKDESASSGSRYSRSAVVTIPSDVLRSYMMVTVAQSVRTYSYSYSYYPYSYYYPYSGYYPYGRSWYNASYNRYWWPTYYLTRSYSDSVENGLAPLSYVLATTPEYTELKGEYDKLRTDYTRLSEEDAALNTRFNKLQEDYNTLMAQNDSLGLALAFTRIALFVVVAAVAVICILMLLQKRGKIVIKSPVVLKKDKP